MMIDLSYLGPVFGLLVLLFIAVAVIGDEYVDDIFDEDRR